VLHPRLSAARDMPSLDDLQWVKPVGNASLLGVLNLKLAMRARWEVPGSYLQQLKT
jgi:hypothetical protein